MTSTDEPSVGDQPSLSTTTRVLAALVALLVLVRVAAPMVTSLLLAQAALLAGASLVLLVVSVAFVMTAGSVALGIAPAIRWYAAVAAALLVVLGCYLLLGLALGLSVPWTAFATWLAVALLSRLVRRTG